jgi:uncharacterized protein YjbJ (UPF0337 family)
MQWNEVETKWNQLQGQVREKFAKLTDEDIRAIGGKKDQFLAKLQERYGMARSQAEKELDVWLQNLREPESRARTSGAQF